MTTQNENNKISEKQICELRGQLLKWYDAHARILPWRSLKGKTPDPYHVWLSEIMLQQTTVQAVQPYFEKFLHKWPCVQDLAAADTEDVMHAWAGLGYYARARNLHKCAKIVANDLNGTFPSDQKSLQALPGIGDYTSAAILTIAFNKPATVMDGNIERIMARYFAVEDPLPKSKPQLKALAADFFAPNHTRPGDFAQALMDLGATICIPKAPRCTLCPIPEACKGRIKGIAETLPQKIKKKPSPKKVGHVYWIQNTNGQILLHRRPEKGLLGGMIALPTSEWLKNTSKPADLGFINNYQSLNKTVHHAFTHFELTLTLKTATMKAAKAPEGYIWHDIPESNNSGFPSVFEKAFHLFIKIHAIS